MKVLVGVDESAHAEATLEFVRGMSWPADTEIVVVSAVALPAAVYSEAYAPAVVDMSRLLADLTRLHQDVASRSARTLAQAGLHARERVPLGDARDVLIEEAQKERADLIIVGSHGRTGLAKLLMGSVASHVVTHAPCSVLVVRRAASGEREKTS